MNTNKLNLTELFRKTVLEEELKVKSKVAKYTLISSLILSYPLGHALIKNVIAQNILQYSGFVGYVIWGLNLLVWLGVSYIAYLILFNLINTIIRVHAYMYKGFYHSTTESVAVLSDKVEHLTTTDFYFETNRTLSKVTVSKSYASFFNIGDSVPVTLEYMKNRNSDKVVCIKGCLCEAIEYKDVLNNLTGYLTSNFNPKLSLLKERVFSLAGSDAPYKLQSGTQNSNLRLN